MAPDTALPGSAVDEAIRDEPDHKGLAQLLEMALAGPTEAPNTQEHGRVVNGPSRVDHPRQEGGCAQVLGAGDVGLRQRRRHGGLRR